MDLNCEQEIILENNRVRLEPLKQKHLELLLPIALAYPNLLQYSPSPFGTKEKMEIYIQEALKARAEGSRYAFAIYDKKQEKFVGSTSFGSISNKDKRIEIGWTWLDKTVQGTGLNKECKYLLLKYAFESLEFERVEFRTDSRNLQSRAAIEKIGGKYEGELRSHTLMQDGYRRNTVYYSILKSEWGDVKKTF